MAYFFRLPKYDDLTIGQKSALNEPESISVSGGPGTGKSVVALWRHIRNYGIGNTKSLLLTYTITMENYLAKSAEPENDSAGSAVSRTYWWLTHEATEYDEIIVDETQDVEEIRYHNILNYSNSVSYSADDQQIVYPNRATSQNRLAQIFPNNKHYVLDENFRNSYEIMHFVRALFPNKLVPQNVLDNLIEHNRRGNKPILLISNNNPRKQLATIIDIIKQFISETHNIAILVPLRQHVNSYYNSIRQENIVCSKYECDDRQLTTIENVHITTFKSAKGTEFDTVIIPDFENMQDNIDQLTVVDENDYYVAITRARRNLYLISSSVPVFLTNSQAQIDTYNQEVI